MKYTSIIITTLAFLFIQQLSFAQAEKPYFKDQKENKTLEKYKKTDASYRSYQKMKKQYYKPSTRTHYSDENMLILEYGKAIKNVDLKARMKKYPNDSMKIYKKAEDIAKYTKDENIKVVIIIEKKKK